ncbi:MAG TPA: riboflavin synthase [Gaiellaceae bacterium]|nr:riboflavin synthase [Gaiellaceae bacterium]
MFTGIVRGRGRIVSADGDADGMRLVVEATTLAEAVAIGDSVSVNGVCLTVTDDAPEGTLVFAAVPETLARTSLSVLAAGDQVNLEPALRAGEPLGGHYVQGHVDAVGHVRSIERDGIGARMRVVAPSEILRYLVEKGSVAVEGVSLTVAGLDDAGFEVALIPHTLAETTLSTLDVGRAVNVEVDVLAKYVERLVAHR